MINSFKKKLKMKVQYALAMLVMGVGLTFLNSCNQTSKLSDSNVSEIYKRGKQVISPDFEVYHNSTSQTTIYFRVNTSQLLYARNQESNELNAKFKVAYLLYKAYDSNELIDSASTILEDVAENSEARYIIGNFEIKTPILADYVLKIITTDLNKKNESIRILNIQKSSLISRQNFLVIDPETQLPLFRNYLYKNEKVLVKYNQLKPSGKVIAKIYEREFPVAPPPFAQYTPAPFNYTPNNSLTIPINDSNTFSVSFENKGFIHFQIDSESRLGLTLFHFSNDFPEVNSVPEMISALRFITSKKEYENLNAASNQKEALEEFWLKTSSNSARAKEMIRTFYNRVQNANFYFSSYKEGWKTDRGIVYMIFGPPSVVYKSSTTESWVYGEENNYLSTSFNFTKVNNPFSDNDFSLTRNLTYKNPWYRAVDAWRQGRVATLDY